LGIAIIEEEPDKDRGKRKWEFVGSVDLQGRLDKMNVRDFAHE
jgi:hypothetical protein